MKYKNLTYKDLDNEQLNFIISNYGYLKDKDIAAQLNISKSTLSAHISNLLAQGILIKAIRKTTWTYEEEQKILRLVNECSVEELANILNKTYNAIIAKLRQLKRLNKLPADYVIRQPLDTTFLNTEISQWSNAEDELLITYVAKYSVKTIALKMHKSTYDIIMRFYKLQKKYTLKTTTTCKDYIWNEQYDLYLVKNFEHAMKDDIINNIPTFSWRQIIHRAKLFGLSRSKSNSLFIPYTEKLVKQILDKYHINYKFRYYLYYEGKHYYILDFLLANNVIIEVQGDYWHCNPIVYPNPDEIQLRKIAQDKQKFNTLTELGYRVIYIWEYDLNYNLQQCEDYIRALLPDCK